jgi:AMMECR1 domain-containing protein
MALSTPTIDETSEKEQKLRGNIGWFASMMDKPELEILEAMALELAKRYSDRYQKWREANN